MAGNVAGGSSSSNQSKARGRRFRGNFRSNYVIATDRLAPALLKTGIKAREHLLYRSSSLAFGAGSEMIPFFFLHSGSSGVIPHGGFVRWRTDRSTFVTAASGRHIAPASGRRSASILFSLIAS